MLTKEYEGKNERECIDTAVQELSIPEEKLDIEVLQKGKSGFFGLGGSQKAVIKVSYNEGDRENGLYPMKNGSLEEYEEATIDFLVGLFNRMELDVDIEVDNDNDSKVFIDLASDNSALIIGKRGKTLEAVQMLSNIVAGKQYGKGYKSVINIEQYREKRQKILTDLAHKVADEVRKSGKPRSLEPMNPFERRLIHLAIQDERDVETRSEGEGVMRKVTVFPK